MCANQQQQQQHFCPTFSTDFFFPCIYRYICLNFARMFNIAFLAMKFKALDNDYRMNLNKNVKMKQLNVPFWNTNTDFMCFDTEQNDAFSIFGCGRSFLFRCQVSQIENYT